MKFTELDTLSLQTIRTLSIDAVQKAKSGHPGMPMGCAPMAYVLWTRFLKHNPTNPDWISRDRFVLSAGHGSMLLYSLMHLFGYGLTIDDLKKFRQFGSLTPGHPENHLIKGVETTSGPLGQGFANGIGMAIAQKYLSAKYNKPDFLIFDYKIFGIVSDGDLMEGVSSEAASLAGHLKLGNIIYLYDDNKISIDGSTDLSFSENVSERFNSYGWHTQKVEDGNNLEKIFEAISNATTNSDRPSLIQIRTQIGFGSPNKQNTADAHGSPLGDDEVKQTKKFYNLDPEKYFEVSSTVYQNFQVNSNEGKNKEAKWNELFKEYSKKYNSEFNEIQKIINSDFGNEWKKSLPIFNSENGNIATREASGKVLESIFPHLPTLIGGSADLTPSNNTKPKSSTDFQFGNYSGKYIRFGVREHAMASIANGIALTNGMIPYCATFLVFSDYMRPAIRLAAIMRKKVIYVFTHDSIALGEDGPTHQPIEHLSSLRAIPNLKVIRPADANETVEAWKFAIQHKSGPVALILTRQKLPHIDRAITNNYSNLKNGGYILIENNSDPELILISSGSEVNITLKAYFELIKENLKVRVVSMPSIELFEEQDESYKEKVLPSKIKKRIVIEAGSSQSWFKYVESKNQLITIDHFGASAPGDVLMQEFGFTVENIISKAKKLFL
ncbi:MAG: transketolase [Bacteroidetes bacterium]|nr:transketolase [Bacteroidota bacterium]